MFDYGEKSREKGLKGVCAMCVHTRGNYLCTCTNKMENEDWKWHKEKGKKKSPKLTMQRAIKGGRWGLFRGDLLGGGDYRQFSFESSSSSPSLFSSLSCTPFIPSSPHTRLLRIDARSARELEPRWFSVAYRSGGRSLLGSTFPWCGCARVLTGVEIACTLGDRGRRWKPISIPISCLIFVSFSLSLCPAQVPLL